MIMSLSASHEVTDEVTKRINKTLHDIEKAKKSKKWTDDVDAMHKALKKEGIERTVMEVFSRPRVKGIAE